MRELLSKQVIIGTNFLGKRENDSGLFYASGLISSNVNKTFTEKYISNPFYSDSLLGETILDDTLKQISQQKRENKGLEYRSNAITFHIISMLANGKGSFLLSKIYKDIIEQIYEKVAPVPFFREYLELKTLREQFYYLNNSNYVDINPILQANLISAIHHTLKHLKADTKIANLIFDYMVYSNCKGYYAEELVRGKYINDLKSPLFYDFFKFRLEESDPSYFWYDFPDGKIRFNLEISKLDEIIKKLTQFITKRKYNLIGSEYPERIYLGSSYKPEIKIKTEQIVPEQLKQQSIDNVVSETLEIDPIAAQQTKKILSSKEEIYAAISELKQQHPDEKITAKILLENYEIEEKYIKSVQQYIACHTMAQDRKNKANGSADEVNKNAALESKVNKKSITKNGSSKYDSNLILGALNTGMNEEEVMAAYHLSKQQLAAIKAHQTMGNRQPEINFSFAGITYRGPPGIERIIPRLGKEYGGIDFIPRYELAEHKIKIIE